MEDVSRPVTPASRTALSYAVAGERVGSILVNNGPALRDLRRSAAPVGNLLARYQTLFESEAWWRFAAA
jgi:hypothetical protein